MDGPSTRDGTYLYTYLQVWNHKYLMLPNGIVKYLSGREKNCWQNKKKHKNTLTQFQVWNCKDIMLPNGSIKSLSRREKNVGRIRRSIKIRLLLFSIVNHNL